MNDKPKNDLQQFWSDLKKVYPKALSQIGAKWQLSIVYLFVIVTCFYFDEPVRDLVTGIKITYAADLFDFGRWYGNGQMTLIAFLVLYIGGWLFRNFKLRDAGLLVGESYLFSGLLTLIFKSAFGRWRPYMEHGDFSFNGWSWDNNDQFSFFSGHSQAAFALSVILASTTNNIYLKIFYYSLACITGLSRIYHNQHWLSDVVTGAVIAVFIGKILVEFHKERFVNEAAK